VVAGCPGEMAPAPGGTGGVVRHYFWQAA
jgi:hypothetical protein